MKTNLLTHITEERLPMLLVALNRALNTWDEAPRWLFALCDGLAAGTVTGVTFYEGEVGRGKAVAPLSGNGHEGIYEAIEFVPLALDSRPVASTPWPTENKGQPQ